TEDGIRAFHVTGVQTCALPISGSPWLFVTLLAITAGLALVFGVPALRRNLISRWLFPAFAKLLPRMGKTERIALEAGTVWWDGEIGRAACRGRSYVGE